MTNVCLNPNTYVMAGLLTLSIPDAFPLHLIFTRICSGAGYRNFYRRLQQRVLSRIHTWFPIIRKQCVLLRNH